MHAIGVFFGHLLARYGDLAVVMFFVAEGAGIPVPSETMLVTAAAYAGRGKLSIWGVIAAASAGGVLAGSVGYAIGVWGGLPLIRRYGRLVRIDDARLAWARRFFRDHGAAASLLARFLAWLRILVPMLAGVAEMPFGRFSAYNAVGAVGSAVVYGTLGYVFGHNLSALEHHLALTTAVVVALALMMGLTVAVRRRRARRRAGARSATLLLLCCAGATTTGCDVVHVGRTSTVGTEALALAAKPAAVDSEFEGCEPGGSPPDRDLNRRKNRVDDASSYIPVPRTTTARLPWPEWAGYRFGNL